MSAMHQWLSGRYMTQYAPLLERASWKELDDIRGCSMQEVALILDLLPPGGARLKMRLLLESLRGKELMQTTSVSNESVADVQVVNKTESEVSVNVDVIADVVEDPPTVTANTAHESMEQSPTSSAKCPSTAPLESDEMETKTRAHNNTTTKNPKNATAVTKRGGSAGARSNLIMQRIQSLQQHSTRTHKDQVQAAAVVPKTSSRTMSELRRAFSLPRTLQKGAVFTTYCPSGTPKRCLVMLSANWEEMVVSDLKTKAPLVTVRCEFISDITAGCRGAARVNNAFTVHAGKTTVELEAFDFETAKHWKSALGDVRARMV